MGSSGPGVAALAAVPQHIAPPARSQRRDLFPDVEAAAGAQEPRWRDSTSWAETCGDSK